MATLPATSQSALTKYEPVIGLEVHVQLLTTTKIFCSCSTKFGAAPNTHVCPVCLGLPGALPVLNEKAVEFATQAAMALNCRINETSIFARKNYFYPDLPKGYQISQYDKPLAEHGYIEIAVAGGMKKIGITRLHLEEDAGKSLHEGFLDAGDKTAIDLNRTGTPLAEIVSEPDIRSPEEAYEYLTKLKEIILYTGVSDCNMEEGSLRCDANVSVRPRGQQEFGTKTEIKNVNSFRFVREALEYEIERQIDVLESGGKITQETRLYNTEEGKTYSMRSKEQAHDYRYFPEPDLPPLALSEAYVEAAKASLPELPEERYDRYTGSSGLILQDAGVLVAERDVADYFDATVAAGASPKKAANWVINEVLARVDDARRLAEPSLPVPAAALSELIALVEAGTLSGKLGKDVFLRMWNERRRAADIVAAEGLAQVSDSGSIEEVCRKVIAASPGELERYRAGDKKLLGFFVGAVMKETGGKANPKSANEILRRLLDQGA